MPGPSDSPRLDNPQTKPPPGIPSAVEFFTRAVFSRGLGLDDPVFTEKDFSPAELDALRTAKANAEAAGRNYIAYEDYVTARTPNNAADPTMLGSNATNIFQELALMADPARSAKFTLGRAGFEGDVISDTYDFHGDPEIQVTPDVLQQAFGEVLNDPNPRALFNLIGNLAGLREGTGPSVNVNLAQPQAASSIGL